MAAPDPCNPCGTCVPPNVGNDQFKVSVLVALCEILTAISEGTLTASPTVLPDVVKAYSFFLNTYQALGLVDAEKKLSHIVVTNNSDGDYALSLNNSSEHYRVLANSYKVIDFDGRNVSVTTDLYAKWVQQPSLGSVIFEAYYYAV